MVGAPIILVRRPINPGLIIDLWILPLCPKTSEMAKEQERKVEPPGIEPRAFGIPCHCSATKLQLPPATTPHSCPYIACSSVLLISIDNIDIIDYTLYYILYPIDAMYIYNSESSCKYSTVSQCNTVASLQLSLSDLAIGRGRVGEG